MSVSKGEETYAEYHSVPMGALRKHLKNVNCFDDNDKIELYAQTEVNSVSPNVGALEQLGCEDLIYGGTSFDNPSGKVYYHYFVTKNNITTEYYDTLEVIPNEINVHLIEY